VVGETGLRFYAGLSLVAHDGHEIGTLCVIDRVPRMLTPEQRAALGALGRQAVARGLRRNLTELARALRDRTEGSGPAAARPGS
jgi:GAF domain-containing protein